MVKAILDGREIDTRAALHETLARALELPPYYGRNLDALFDCLTDIRQDAEIQLLHREELEERLGSYFHGLLAVLRRAEEENAHITLT